MLRTQKDFIMLSIKGCICLALLSFSTSCAPMEEQEAKPEYQETKQIVLDIIQTEDGKKAISKVIVDDETKRRLLMDEAFIKDTIHETLLAEDHKEIWQKFMMDPEFATEYAQQMEDQYKDFIKDLMKDPDFRKDMIEILHEPEMGEHFLEMTKTNEFRTETMDVMQESLRNPYFRLQIRDLLKQVSFEDLQSEESGEGGENSEG